LYAGFGFGRNTVAEGRAITPTADGMQYCLIFARSAAIQDEGAMHASVGADNEADAYSQIFIIQLK